MLHHVSHTDMDGVGCHIVSYHLFGDPIKFYSADYDNVDELLRKILTTLREEDTILITDLSPSAEDVIAALDKLYEDGPWKTLLVDHHKTALERLGDKEWANVGMEACATKRLLHYYEDEFDPDMDLYNFVNMVNDHDLWIHKDPRSLRFNDLLWIIGLEEFRTRFMNDLSLDESETERVLIDANSRANTEYVDKAVRTARILTDSDGTKFAFVFAEKLAGSIAEILLKQHPEIQYVLVRNAQQESVSLRSRNGEYDVSVLAKSRGGGGHPAASGYPLKSDDLLKVV